MPFNIPKDCNQKVAWELCYGEGTWVEREGFWGSLQRRVKAFFAFPWKLDATQIKAILEDSTRREIAIKTIVKNPRWFRSSLTSADAVCIGEIGKMLVSSHADKGIQDIAQRCEFEKMAKKRCGPRCNLHDLLMLFAWQGETESLKKLLALCPDLVNKRAKNGETPLVRAAVHGNLQCVEALLNAGADVNKPNKHDLTPLYWAAYRGHAPCVKALLEKDARTVTFDTSHRTPLHLAMQEGHVKCAVHILKRDYHNMRYHDYRVRSGVVPNLIKDNIEATICAAMKYGYNVLVDELAKEFKVSDNTMLMQAVQAGHAIYINKFRGVEGIDVNGALMFAARNGYAEGLAVLLGHPGVDVNSALFEAVRHGHVKCVEVLMTVVGSDANPVDANGFSAVVWALACGHMECVEALLGGRELSEDEKNRALLLAAGGASKISSCSSARWCKCKYCG